MITGHHYSAKYDAELADLRVHTLVMGRLVEKQLKNAIDAMIFGDRQIAKRVTVDEIAVNRMEVDIDSKCMEVLARRQPTAGDLRFVMMNIKTVNDLERMGDEAGRVARMATRVAEQPGGITTYDDIEAVGSRVLNLFHETLEAFEETDDFRALALIKQDKKVDKKYKNTLKRIIQWMTADPESIPDAVDILWAIRSLERIGDRSCNICQHVIYLARGEDIRHINIDDIIESD